MGHLAHFLALSLIRYVNLGKLNIVPEPIMLDGHNTVAHGMSGVKIKEEYIERAYGIYIIQSSDEHTPVNKMTKMYGRIKLLDPCCTTT